MEICSSFAGGKVNGFLHGANCCQTSETLIDGEKLRAEDGLSIGHFLPFIKQFDTNQNSLVILPSHMHINVTAILSNTFLI